jgi:hypothetical protein
VSDPSAEETNRLGISELHTRHVFVEIVRHMLSAGWSVAYGGDFRQCGYTNALVDLVRTYERREAPGPERVRAYLAWPIWAKLTQRDRAELVNVAILHEIPAPQGAPRSLPPASERTPRELLWASLALTAMREQMTRDLDARVVLGGRLDGQQGLTPGIAEEALLALEGKKPLFVLGGYGGCARALVACIKGDRVRELTTGYQAEHTARYVELLAEARSAQTRTVDVVAEDLRSFGMQALGNGLTEEENERLFASDEIDEVVALILRGLRRRTGDRLS